MSEGQPRELKIPTDLTQIPIVWRYEMLKYLRSRRLLASVAIALVVIGLIYALPPALGHPYSGTDSGTNVTIVDLEYFNIQPGLIPYQSIGLLDKTGVDTSTIKIYVSGVEVPRGPSTWVISGTDSAPLITAPGVSVVLLFATNMTGQDVTATYEWRTPAREFDSTFLNFASILVIICATFFGADAIVGEYQNRTGYLIFPNPVKREVLFFGKYSASMTAGLMVVGLFYLCVSILSFVTVGAVAGKLGVSFVFAFEYLLATMAVAYVISSVLKGTTGSTVLTFFMFVMILPIIDSVSMFAGVKIEGSLTFVAGVIQYILQDPYPTDTSQSIGGFNIHSFYPEPATAAIVMFVYMVAAIVISLALFKRKQLTG